jgi:hypothetical protein
VVKEKREGLNQGEIEGFSRNFISTEKYLHQIPRGCTFSHPISSNKNVKTRFTLEQQEVDSLYEKLIGRQQ